MAGNWKYTALYTLIFQTHCLMSSPRTYANGGEAYSSFRKSWSTTIWALPSLWTMLIRKEDVKYDLVVAHDWLSAIGGMTVKKESGLPLLFTFTHRERKNSWKRLDHRQKHRASRRQCSWPNSDSFVRHERRARRLGFPKEKIQFPTRGRPWKIRPSAVPKEKIKKFAVHMT